MKKVLFIINPKAGKGLIKRNIFTILDIFVKNEMDITIYLTQKRLDACEIVKNRANEFDLIVCSGGDGTLDEVVTGILEGEHSCPIGYIPAGSTNDFAHSLKIPSVMEKAAQIIVQNHTFACDIGAFNNNYFVYIAAFGIFTEVSYKTNQDMKNLLGHLAYTLNGAQSLLNIKSYSMKIRTDALELEGDFIYGMVTNSESVGGFKHITGKRVQYDDGLFEVVLIKKPITPMNWASIITGLMNQETDNKYIYFLKTSSIYVQADENVAWTLDGEAGGEHKNVCIKNHKQRIQIMVGSKQS